MPIFARKRRSRRCSLARGPRAARRKLRTNRRTMQHFPPVFHASDAIAPILFPLVYIALSSLIKEPNRRHFNAIMIGGAGAAYLSGGGLGKWEFLFTAMVTYCAYKGLASYRFIGIGWMLHVAWDLMHHFYGNPIVPF